jgi:hypothetical protein
MGLPLHVTCHFSFAVFDILSMFCLLSVLIMSACGCFFSDSSGLVFLYLDVPPFLENGEVLSYYAFV